MSNSQIASAQTMLNAIEDAMYVLKKESENRNYLKFYSHAMKHLLVSPETPEQINIKREKLR